MTKDISHLIPLNRDTYIRTPKPLLLIDTSVGAQVLIDAANDRFGLVRNITEVLACSQSDELSKLDIPNLFFSLNVLLDEVQSLNNAAFDAARVQAKPPKCNERQDASKKK